jgi:hypothetical protein
MAKENSHGLMEAPITVSLLKITLMVTEFINGRTAENMKENGRTIRWREAECLHGLTTEDMKVNILMIKRRATVSFTGLMEENTTEIGKTENNMEQGHILQLLARPDKVNGLKAKEPNGFELIDY